MNPFDIMEQLEKEFGLSSFPVTWPIGSGEGGRSGQRCTWVAAARGFIRNQHPMMQLPRVGLDTPASLSELKLQGSSSMYPQLFVLAPSSTDLHRLVYTRQDLH
jgi:hypothetical protein